MESPSEIKITVYGKTDVGLMREHNEDNFLVVDFASAQRPSPEASLDFSLGEKGALFLVCDGMGGAAAGEVASTMAVESISSAVGDAGPLSRERFARRLRRAIEDANDNIYTQSRDNQNERGMGTTCTAVGLVDATLLIGQVGDSRCYVLRGGRLSQTTKDQSLAWQLIEAGAIPARIVPAPAKSSAPTSFNANAVASVSASAVWRSSLAHRMASTAFVTLGSLLQMPCITLAAPIRSSMFPVTPSTSASFSGSSGNSLGTFMAARFTPMNSETGMECELA